MPCVRRFLPAVGLLVGCGGTPQGKPAATQPNEPRPADHETAVPTFLRVEIDRTMPASHVIAITAGDVHTCALREDGTVLCWGKQQPMGQPPAGIPPAAPYDERVAQARPQQVEGVRDAVQIAAGAHHTCAVTRSGGVTCWGGNEKGELGGPGQRVDVPVEGAVEVSAGDWHSCARLRGGEVTCWGANDFGQVGSRSLGSPRPPTTVAGLPPAEQITLSKITSCARTKDGAVHCWGYDPSWSIGLAPNERGSLDAPTRLPLPPVSAFHVADNVACHLDLSHRVHCSGWEFSFLPGMPPNMALGKMPEGVEGSPATNVVVRRETACAQLPGGQYGCASFPRSPTSVPTIRLLLSFLAHEDVTDLALGTYHACALIRGGYVMCWGANGHGQAGDAWIHRGQYQKVPGSVPAVPNYNMPTQVIGVHPTPEG